MLNCWDNLDGSVERGYAGRSLFFEDGHLAYDPERIRNLGRLLASCGINLLCINNVNLLYDAQRLMEDLLPDVGRLASLLRPFGVRLMLSCDFALPLRHGLDTADPLDERVQAFWRDRADILWDYVPDLAGFLVKADSEHRPGPFTYGRSHAEGANMLAEAVSSHGGIIVWRAFVYNCFEHYMPLDGQFRDNVILQIKNGPYDFQVEEPISPLLLGLKNTRLAMEFQLTQEYTGHQVDIYAMPTFWKEVFADLPEGRIHALAGVANFGRDRCITGHPFAALNLFGFGQIAWDPKLQPEGLIEMWCKLTYPDLDEEQHRALCDLLLCSRQVYAKYTACLGLDWMVVPGLHYGPSPDGYEYASWGTYHRADRNAVGIDRTGSGTGYLLQYPPELQARYGNPDTCPEELLLFFHRLRYDHVLRDGRTLIQRIYDDHFEGYEAVLEMEKTLRQLAPALPDADAQLVLERIEKQKENAREWRDVVNTFFHRLSGVEDAKGRIIYD